MIAAHRRRSGIRVVAPIRRRPALLVVAVAAIAGLISVAAATVGLSLALFTAQAEPTAIFGTKALFPGEHVTPAFQVGDASSGALINRSSPLAFAADGLTITTSAWATAFASNRYLEFDLNRPLASGVAVTAPTFDFTFASSGAGQACYHFEIRRRSTGAVLGTYGSSGSPVGCVTGSTLTSFSTAISSVATTSIADDLRIRVFGKEAAGATTIVDRATVGGSTAYQTFTLYPVMFRDVADTTAERIPWELDVP